jgi:hypothetical protein
MKDRPTLLDSNLGNVAWGFSRDRGQLIAWRRVTNEHVLNNDLIKIA